MQHEIVLDNGGGSSSVGALLATLICLGSPLESVAQEKAENYVFDRPIERSMKLTDTRFLDLDSGTFVEEVQLDGLKATPSEKGDLYCNIFESDSRVRYAHNLALAPVPQGAKAEELKPADIMRMVSGRTAESGKRLPPGEWAFRTAQGGVGLLKLTPEAGTVLVQYKLVKLPLKFAPVTRFVLGGARAKEYLDLETGKVYGHKPEPGPVAYLEHEKKMGWVVVIEGAHNYKTEKERGEKLWTSTPAEEVAEPAGLGALPFERTGFYPATSAALPCVIWVPGWGLIRLVAVEKGGSDAPVVNLEIKKVDRTIPERK